MDSAETTDFVVESFEGAAIAVQIVINAVVVAVGLAVVLAGNLLFVAPVECDLMVVAATNSQLLNLVTLGAG